MVGTNRKGLTPLGRERWAPWALGILCAGFVALAQGNGWISPPAPAAGYPAAILSLGGVLTGFMATLKAILYGMNPRTHTRLVESGYIDDLATYLSEALWGSLAMCVFSLVSFYAPNATSVHAILVGVTAFAIACVARVTTIGTSLLRIR